MYKLKSERGDTIVEVMIALMVLALAFSIAYSTANKSLASVRNSQEHSEALQFLGSQIELARAASGDAELYKPGVGNRFCMKPGSTAATPEIVRPIDGTCTIAGIVPYSLSIQYDNASDDIFTFTVTWPGIGSIGQQKEQLFYKLHKL